MPATKNYIVTQTRKVHVSALTSIEAALIATAAFENGQNIDQGIKDPGSTRNNLDGVWGNTTSWIETVETNVKLEE